MDELEVLQGEVNGLSNTHIDYAVEDEGFQAAIGRCVRHYTQSVVPDTQEDHLILAAIETVTTTICSSIFEARRLLVEDPDADETSMTRAKEVLRELMGRLRWTTWKECPACGFNELCFTPMWPLGDKASYERPTCKNATTLTRGYRPEDGYWQPTPGFGRPPPEDSSIGEEAMKDL